MTQKKLPLSLFLILIFFLTSIAVFAEDWYQVKDTHFVVFYNNLKDKPMARGVLRKAEKDYKKIASQIGYSRHSKFWTWDERVKIVIFADQESFIQNTGEPAWSHGYAFSHSQLFNSRMIISYKEAQNFLDGLLPHEISHLILKDFIGFSKKIPMWFDEGVAQLQEAHKMEPAHQIMKMLVEKDKYFSFKAINELNIRDEEAPQKVTIFYAQSLTMVNFLLKNYGSRVFGELCRYLKEGRDMEEALRSAYPNAINSFEDFEKKWISYVERH